jgi:hypothetical protein
VVVGDPGSIVIIIVGIVVVRYGVDGGRVRHISCSGGRLLSSSVKEFAIRGVATSLLG